MALPTEPGRWWSRADRTAERRRTEAPPDAALRPLPAAAAGRRRWCRHRVVGARAGSPLAAHAGGRPRDRTRCHGLGLVLRRVAGGPGAVAGGGAERRAGRRGGA